jgi:hypothetical protein
MSGGRFNYNQHRIYDIAETIQSIIDGNKSRDDEFDYGLTDDVLPTLRDAVKALRIAHVYAHRVDWFLSGDDGEEQFVKRLHEELEALK